MGGRTPSPGGPLLLGEGFAVLIEECPMSRLRPLAAGNWKMNGLAPALAELTALGTMAADPAKGWGGVDLLICPPATLISRAAAAAGGGPVRIGGQDCHPKAAGAHTGDLSAAMLADAGAGAVILGHSERRADHGEGDGLVAAKALSAWGAGLLAIVCVGETLGERDAGTTLAVVNSQLAGSLPEGATGANLVVAYEPVWAIGTGRTPTLEQIGEVHQAIRATLTTRFGGEGAKIRILYGGSVKPDNADAIARVGDVNGALVGGASLKAQDFAAIIQAFANTAA